MAHSVYDYVASVHHYGQVVAAVESVHFVGDGDVRGYRAAYASVRINGDDGSRQGSGWLDRKDKRKQTQEQQGHK